jgi:hypothetical protein
VQALPEKTDRQIVLVLKTCQCSFLLFSCLISSPAGNSTSNSNDTNYPSVLWAQRSNAKEADKNVLFVAISAPDVDPSSAKLNLTPTSISFAGESTTKKVAYKVDLELYDEIDVDQSKTHHSPRGIDLVLRKKEAKAEFWPRLLKEAKKVHFLKTDFDKVGDPLFAGLVLGIAANR